MKFSELNISDSIKSIIKKNNLDEMTKVQVEVIPRVIDRKNVLASANTGTGKTLSFVIPIVNNLKKEKGKITTLVLSPTKELSLQTRDVFRTYLINTDYKCSVILGGSNQKSQKELLAKGLDILVATPGRLLDLIRNKKIDLSLVDTLVIDEIDEMVKKGFLSDLKDIVSVLPSSKQVLMFSATINDRVKAFFRALTTNYEVIELKNENSTDIKQEFICVTDDIKFNIFKKIILNSKRTLVFTDTLEETNYLVNRLKEYKINVQGINSSYDKTLKGKIIRDFKENKIRVLISTDLMARGIDIEDLELVLNYNVPELASYTHRIGRTGRGGSSGKAITLYTEKELNKVKKLTDSLNIDLKVN